MSVLEQFRHRQVRDLAYSCFSEPLIHKFYAFASGDTVAHCSLGLTEQRMAWLLLLDQNPEPLQIFLAEKQAHRLGLYHEALWHFFLLQDRQVELLAHNVQIVDDGRTLGEFDLIYFDRLQHRTIHLELAYKVYLQDLSSANSGLMQWLGPNSNDRLGEKLEHMLSHQCRLSRTQAGQQKLRSMGISAVKQEISLRGRLFSRGALTSSTENVSLLNPRHQHGQWWRLAEFASLLEACEHWIVLERLDWISPVSQYDGKMFLADQLQGYLHQYFSQCHTPLMICALDSTSRGIWSELCRVMVVGEDWPE